ncbi:MAG: glycosyltransferase, partial [Acidobacteria bacterium]|nr:glycosyltransferase [Acidobacteriota bacterium]
MKQKKKNLHRVLYIENGIGYGGAVICLRHLIRNLNPDRFRPFVVTTRSGQEYEGIAQEAGWFHFSDRIVDLKNVKRSIENSSFLNSHKIIKAVLNQGIARFDDLVNFIPFLIWLLTVVFRVRPSLIHANNEPLCNRAGILLGKIFRIPVICHFRGNIEGSRMMQW